MKRDGFTLVELIVIMTIFTIMASVVLVNFQGFKSQVAVNNMAHDVGLLLREAQTFGWATLSEDDGVQIQLAENPNTGELEPRRFAHGVFFRYDGTYFSDDLILYKKNSSEPLEQFYDDNNDQEIDRATLNGPYTVVKILGSASREDLKLNNDHEIPGGLWGMSQDVSIAFSRPRPEAFMFEGGSSVQQNYVGIYIGEEGQSQTAEKVIIVSRSGEIIVQ